MMIMLLSCTVMERKSLKFAFSPG